MAPRQRVNNGEDGSKYQISNREDDLASSKNEKLSINSKNSSEKSTDVKEQKMLQQRSDVAREIHDFFNLVALPIVGAALGYKFGWNIFLSGVVGPHYCLDDDFYVALGVTISYFLADLLWVAVVPYCVKSPSLIIKHHISAIFYMCGTVIFPDYSCFFGPCISVEVNTYFLILRRILYKRRETVPAFVISLNEFAFYLSWIVIRIIIYPLVLHKFLHLVHERILLVGTIFQARFLFVITHAFLCVLNLKWSYDLFRPVIKRMFNKENSTAIAPSSGL